MTSVGMAERIADISPSRRMRLLDASKSPLRSGLARTRAVEARSALANCRFCAHLCGVNRLAGEMGFCRAGAETRIFSAQMESGDELELIPTFAIALSGCDLRCDFCITGAESWNAGGGDDLDVEAVASQANGALEQGARSVMILGGEPTVHLPAVLEIVAALPEFATLVWKTNAHGSVEARELLDGMFDVWLADLKFGNDACALRLAKAPNYLRVVRQNLVWADKHSELIVRHLLMPGHVECCWRPVAEWLAANLPGVKTSLHNSFWPAWYSAQHRELLRTVSGSESRRALEIARHYGLNLVE